MESKCGNYTCVSLCTQLCKSRPGNDRYSDRGMQTINDAPKPKLIQTEQVIKTVSHTLSIEVVHATHHMWQSRVEIKGYSIVYFDHITAFEVPHR